MSVVFTYPIPSSSYKHYLLGSLVSGRPVTIVAWAKADDYWDGNERAIVEVGRDDPDYCLRLSRAGASTLGLACTDNMGSATSVNSYPDVWVNAQWNHVCVTTPDNASRAIWFNGVKYTGSTSSGTGTDSMTRITVGMSLKNSSSPYSFDGKVAHVAAWDIVLDDADIQDLAAKLVRPQNVEPDHLLGYWTLSDGPEAFVGDDLTEQGYTSYISYDPGDDPLLQWYAPFYGFSQFSPQLTCITLAPAWQSWTLPVTETLLFNTQILQSHDRTEQRIALRRGVPQQRIKASFVLADAAEISRFDAVVHHWAKRPWPMPLWPQAVQHAGVLAAGASVLEIDTRYAQWQEGGYGLIWQPNRRQIIQVASKSDAALTLSTTLSAGVSGDKWIMPLRSGYCFSVVSKEHRVGGSAVVEVTLLAMDNEAVTGYAADLEYDGLPVLTRRSWLEGDSQAELYDPDMTFLDAGTGVVEIVSNSLDVLAGQPHIWRCTTPRECWSLRQFLHQVKGSQGEFLVPTFRQDLVLARPVGAADTSVYVCHRGLASNLGSSQLRRYAALRPSPADLIVRKVSDIAEESSSVERIDLDAAVGRVFMPGQSLCWVDKCRLKEDAVELQWRRIGELTCSVDLVRTI